MDDRLRELERAWRENRDDFMCWRAWRLALKRSGRTDSTPPPRAPDDSVAVGARAASRKIFFNTGQLSKAGKLAAAEFRNLYGCDPLKAPAEAIHYGRPHVYQIFVYPMCDIEIVDRAIDEVVATAEKEKKENGKPEEPRGRTRNPHEVRQRWGRVRRR